ncbi:MAG TPA: type IX secretion system membrane protein PorP/SprF [Cytophagales bacterium]|nr:type IX secretion system membrane protein PorP/SprF [Cytophagales bacterium]
MNRWGCTCASWVRYLLWSLWLFVTVSTAQDIQFSQFYSSSMYVNPAFAGSAHAGRLTSHTRYQWPKLDARYFTTLASFDFIVPKTFSSIGIIALKDWQGSRNVTTSELHLIYSHEIHLSETFTCRLGLQGGYVSRNINYAVLNFPDQFSNNGPLDMNTGEPFGLDKVTYVDVSSGALLYSKNIWISVAGHHLNMPNQSFYNKESRLPYKFSLAGGYKFILNTKYSAGKGEIPLASLVPSINYKMQGKSDQLDLGLYYIRNNIMTGVWYRGLPLIKRYDRGLQNHESLALLLGWKNQDLSISYSYDIIISKLNPALPGGAHEINLTYLFEFPKKRFKRYRTLPCPDFYKD